MERKYKHTTNIKLRLMSQSFNMGRNEPFIESFICPVGMDGWREPSFATRKQPAKQKTLQGYSKNQLRYLSTFPMGDVSGI